MQSKKNIVEKAFVCLGEYLSTDPDAEMEYVVGQSCIYNSWFDIKNVYESIKNIGLSLSKENISKWLSSYTEEINREKDIKVIGLVLAGNIPMVGLHDILCVLASGHKAMVKMSSSDNKLIPFIIKKLIDIDSFFEDKIIFVDRLSNFDAVIATGSNNSSRYFEYYFGKYPHIIRKNRNSIAVLNGEEEKSDLENLGLDIFMYFGLGCRNVSKIYVPEGYDFITFFNGIEKYNYMKQHYKYSNNFDYNVTLLMLNKVKYQENGFLAVSENESYSSPIASLHFEYYSNVAELQDKLKEDNQKIQCIVSKDAWFTNSFSFGESQKPMLWDYADGIDTMEFLLKKI